jgi:hypothetical protein
MALTELDSFHDREYLLVQADCEGPFVQYRDSRLGYVAVSQNAKYHMPAIEQILAIKCAELRKVKAELKALKASLEED